MHRKALLLDSQRFKKTKKIYLKRPSEYWLLFFKNNVLTKQPKHFQIRYLLFLFPLSVLMLLIFNVIDFDYFPSLFISLFITFAIFGISGNFVKYPFVDTNSFNHLAKFIIDTKGDVHRNLMNIRLNFTPIQKDSNFINPTKIGLRAAKGVVYKPYELERYKAQFLLKNGTTCIVSLYQISLKIKTTKRRSSGKTKTKYKFKHKFLYVLSLKLNSNDYAIGSIDKLNKSYSKYTVIVYTEDGFHYVKIKQKEKAATIALELTHTGKNKNSYFTEMTEFLMERKIIKPIKTPKLSNNH